MYTVQCSHMANILHSVETAGATNCVGWAVKHDTVSSADASTSTYLEPTKHPNIILVSCNTEDSIVNRKDFNFRIRKDIWKYKHRHTQLLAYVIT